MRQALIVDDEVVICLGIARMIPWEQFGFAEPDCAHTWEDALEAALRQPYSLLITDIRIHERNGLDLIHEMRRRQLCDDFIVISAYAEFEYAQASIEYGVRKYLLKPLNRAVLIASMDEKYGASAEDSGPGDRTQPFFQYSEKVQQALRHLEMYYHEPDLNLTSLSRLFYIHPFCFGQRFSEEIGVHFSDYLNRLRIDKACELLRSTRLSIQQISVRVGFANPSYFHRTFKRLMGTTALNYRRHL